MAPRVVALITAASGPYPWRRIQKGRRTLPRTSERVYRTLAFDVLHHGKFTSHVLRELSNFCCLPGRAGGSPNGLAAPINSIGAATHGWPLPGPDKPRYFTNTNSGAAGCRRTEIWIRFALGEEL